ncbi:MAG TPA: type I-F CRISPR-associated endoribonuclease Cas6/Csy4 [Aquimonas sp.]|nr:type I-F CRISPR-associated endoribonuclease Cas6/Csy4 [Aquimonas sp.]
MHASAYLDIRVHGGADSDLQPAVLRGRLLGILHGCFRQLPQPFAIALPNQRNGLRVFASERTHFDALVSALQGHRWIRDYAHIGYPLQVPVDFAGPWIGYQRFRIPTVKSDRHAEAGRSALRDRRLQEAQQRGLEYFHLHSASNQQRFVLAVEARAHTAPGTHFKPNSYGFGSTDNPCVLPHLP